MSGIARTEEQAPAVGSDPDVETIVLPPYRLMLHNDDVNSMDHVVEALLRCVPELPPEEAVRIMLAAHSDGVALVLVCPLERAELYRDRLEQQGLTSTIERG